MPLGGGKLAIFKGALPMPLDYSKFDHLEDSDDDKPDPKAKEAEAYRKEMAEKLRQRLADGPDADELKKKADSEKKPAHQTDLFAYADADCAKLAQELLRKCLSKTQSVKVGSGVLSVVAVDKVDGDATYLQVRGQARHTFDLNFKVKFAYQWMGSNFDSGAQRAEGVIEVSDFTDATTLTTEKTPPIVKKRWTDKAQIDSGKQKDVEKALGGKAWPPPKGSLVGELIEVLEAFVKALPTATAKSQQEAKENREAAAKEDEEELQEHNGVKIEEVHEE